MCEHCSEEVKVYTLFWRNGKTEKASGITVAAAFTGAGYGGGAVSVLDFYAEGDVAEKWEWKEKRWQEKV